MGISHFYNLADLGTVGNTDKLIIFQGQKIKGRGNSKNKLLRL